MAKRDLMKEHRTPTEIVRDQIILVNLYFQGVPLRDMPKELMKRAGVDYELSIHSIHIQLKEAEAVWAREKVIDIDKRKNIELAKLDSLENEYWYAWHRSCMKREETTIKKERSVSLDLNAQPEVTDGGEVIQPLVADMVITEERIRQYERDGTVKFLEGVERCIKERCKILGLYQPLQVGFGSEGNEQYYDMPLSEVHQRLLAVFQINNTTINVNKGNGEKR